MDTRIVSINSHSYGINHGSNQCLEVNEPSQFITDKNTEFYLQYEINNC